jgi:NTE family protein
MPKYELEPLLAVRRASRSRGPGDLGLVMGGGGARAAYQVGFLRVLARRFPELPIPYVTGVSAGAINAALLASHHGTFLQAVQELSHLWADLKIDDVFRVDARSLMANGFRWLSRLGSGGIGGTRVKGLMDTSPLRAYMNEVLHCVDGELTGVRYNLDNDRLKALAISTTSYTTGLSITWVQGSDVREWERPQRRARQTTITVDHIMASAALPLLFPAVRLGSEWFGDGGMRLTAPLSPALHLGARKIIAVSTRYAGTHAESEEHDIPGYPPPAQVAGVLLNSIFLDLLDHDAARLERLNKLIDHLPPDHTQGLRRVELLTLRPSQDLGKLAGNFEAQLPSSFRFLTRGLGTKETKSPDFLSLVLFQPDYVHTLIEIGEADALARVDEIESFLETDEAPEDES